MNEIFNILEKLEHELADPSTRKNIDRLTHLLADDFQEFGKSGKVYNKPEIITALINEEPQVIYFSNFAFKSISKDSVLVTYKTSCNDVKANRSSIWVTKNGQWQLLHHQGTLCE